MNKPSVIVMFLALVFGCFSCHHSINGKLSDKGGHNFLFLQSNGETKIFFGAARAAAFSVLPQPTLWLLAAQQQQEQIVAPMESDGVRNAFWVGLILLLAVMSFYFFLQYKKRQLAEIQVSKLQKERAILFDHAPCGYHSVDEHGIVITMNETLSQWLGYNKEEIIGKIKFIDLVDADPETAHEKLAALSRGRGLKTELTLTRKSGEKLPVIIGILNAETSGGVSARPLFCSIDNSRCHEAFERIKNLDQELEAFSYSISHDLRAPLRSINGYSQILQEDYGQKLDEEGRRVLKVVINNAMRMGKLIDDLLDFGRLGRKTMQRTHLNMTSLVKSIVQELMALEPTRDMDIIVLELLPASADADMIRQVWFNLLENAVKFTGKTSHPIIEVQSYKTAEGEICYQVKDNGVGFDMQYGEKLFGVFQRLHKMQDFSGTGVGLAIVKRIISRHGGRVWAEGSLSGGATFYFTLPIENENT